MMKIKQKGEGEIAIILVIVFVIIAVIGAIMLIVPPYKAWAAEKRGEGMMRYAAMERNAMISQAEAERDSARLRSEAIEIVGEASQKYPEYRQQEFIGAFAKCLENGCANQIIYVPTEANIPIIEAGKR